MPTIPAETRLKLTDTKQHLSQIVNQVARGESRIVIEKSGLPVAAIISAGEYQRFLQLDAEREKRFAAMERISDAFMDVPLEELEAEVDRAVSEIRSGKKRDAITLP